jgi:glycosyltransferase involved in cell wall biosynthesis
MFGNLGERKNAPHIVKVSVIIPTLNEADNLPLVLPYIPLDMIHEVILVDGGSIDRTIEVAKRLMPSIRVIIEPRRGKGLALRKGYEAASGDILIVLDADGSNDPWEIPRFLLEGADFAKGSRFADQGGTTDMPRIRVLGNSAFVILVNLFFGCKFSDLCYGYHAFWRYCLDLINLSDVDGFEIDTNGWPT